MGCFGVAGSSYWNQIYFISRAFHLLCYSHLAFVILKKISACSAQGFKEHGCFQGHFGRSIWSSPVQSSCCQASMCPLLHGFRMINLPSQGSRGCHQPAVQQGQCYPRMQTALVQACGSLRKRSAFPREPHHCYGGVSQILLFLLKLKIF